jgi:hypothetical protein
MGMTLTAGSLLALAAIVCGFIAGIQDDGSFLFNAVTWFVLAIALAMTLGGTGPGFTFGPKKVS